MKIVISVVLPESKEILIMSVHVLTKVYLVMM